MKKRRDDLRKETIAKNARDGVKIKYNIKPKLSRPTTISMRDGVRNKKNSCLFSVYK